MNIDTNRNINGDTNTDTIIVQLPSITIDGITADVFTREDGRKWFKIQDGSFHCTSCYYMGVSDEEFKGHIRQEVTRYKMGWR